MLRVSHRCLFGGLEACCPGLHRALLSAPVIFEFMVALIISLTMCAPGLSWAGLALLWDLFWALVGSFFTHFFPDSRGEFALEGEFCEQFLQQIQLESVPKLFQDWSM